MKKIFIFALVPAIIMATGCSDSYPKPDESAYNYVTTQEPGLTSESHDENEGKDINTYTDEYLLELAREMYLSACNMTEKYISGSVYSVDHSSTCIRDNQTAYLVSDSMILTMDDISRDWYNVFSSKYADIYKDIFTNFFEENNSIWVIKKKYPKNSYYLDSVISEISNRTENEIEFNVLSTYKNEDGTNKTSSMPFSVAYTADIFKVGKFIMPY